MLGDGERFWVRRHSCRQKERDPWYPYAISLSALYSYYEDNDGGLGQQRSDFPRIVGMSGRLVVKVSNVVSTSGVIRWSWKLAVQLEAYHPG